MSKSRGTGLDPLVYLELGMDPEWLRYYFAYKLNSKVEDVDFSSADFISRTNSDLVGKYVNIASRSAGFLVKRFEGRVSDPAIAESSLISEIKAAAPDINASFSPTKVCRQERQSSGYRECGSWSAMRNDRSGQVHGRLFRRRAAWLSSLRLH